MRDPTVMSQEEIEAAVAAAPNNTLTTVHTEDWGKLPRGQGKRAGYMIRGAMSSQAQGKKHYLDAAGKLSDEERLDFDSLEDMGPRRVAYLKARGAGFTHDFAMDYAMEKSGDLPPGEARRRAARGSAAFDAGDRVLADARKALRGFSPEDLDGIRLWVNSAERRAVLDVMDWGDPKVGKALGKALAEALGGEDRITWQNEGPRPRGEGWVNLRAV